MKANLSKIKEMNLWLKGKFNLCGALGTENVSVHMINECIGDEALFLQKIEEQGGTSDRLIALSNTPDFKMVLRRVAKERNLIEKEIEAQIAHLYHRVSKITHRNGDYIVIRSKDLTINERAAVVCFFELQNEWLVPLSSWREE
ncbi:hypothetical protein BDZ91DRAFT_768284 [Kalaharituber pfeilii]|nr:hypothetical protein BDZ91DRAFT_768284 [Kalaharituber pfeilii]